MTTVTTEFSVGAIKCRIVSDGIDLYPPEVMFTGVSDAELAVALPGWVNDDGLVYSFYSCMLIESEGKFALVDAGLGEFAALEGAPAGRLQESLAETGVEPAQVDAVVITHGHPDHIGGLTVAAGTDRRPVFENAMHYIWGEEWETWGTEAGRASVPDDFVAPAEASLPPLDAAGLITKLSEETEILPGVRVIPAPGHTPGHAVVAIASEGENAINLGDAIVHELDCEHVDWVCAFDMDAGLTIETRRGLLKRAVTEEAIVVAYHLGSAGRIERADKGFRFRPLK